MWPSYCSQGRITEDKPMNNKVQMAKVDAVLDPNLCFFGALLCNLKFQEDASCKTAWTDGTTLAYNPEFIETLPHAEIVGLLAHEALHCAGAHPYRRDGRNHEKWNEACDYATNGILAECGIKLPEGSLQPDPDMQGKSAEWIYDRLPDKPKRNDGNEGCGGVSGSSGEGDIPGEVRDNPGNNGDSEGNGEGDTGQGTNPQLSEADWHELARQAAQQAKSRGKLPAGLDRFSKEASQSRVDWK